MVIKQYKVEKGIATPVNHLETATEGDFYRRKSEGVNWGDFLHEQWHKFEDEKAAHTYATNAQDGVYDADCFKLKWQCYDHDREQWQDAEQSAECTWEKFNEWFRTTRKHLQLIDNPIPKMETTELPSPEKENKEGYVDFRNPFEDYPELSARLLHAANFWKVDDTWSSTLSEINKVCEQLTIAKQSAWQSKEQ